MTRRSGSLLGLLAGTTVVLAAGICGLGANVVVRGSDAAPVIFPLVALGLCAALFFGTLWWRERSTPLNIGAFGALIVVVYAAYPAVVYLLNGLTYSIASDNRLLIAQPVPKEIGLLTWWYVFYFVAFAVFYIAVAKGRGHFVLDLKSVPRGVVWLIVALSIIIEAIAALIGLFYETAGATYQESYVVVQRLPLAVRQIFANVVAMRMTLLILLMCVLFSHYRRARLWIIAIVGWNVATTLRHMHARGDMFILLAVVAFLYHHTVRRFRMSVAFIAVVSLLALSTWMAVVRGGGNVTAREGALGGSEFESILGNAYDLKFVRGASGVMISQPALYFSDIASLVPQQLLPFQKGTKADWYLATFYPASAATGVGFAFGVLSEAITGFGWMEMVVRGALVGLAFGWLHRRYSSRPLSLWELAFYVWLMAWSYQIVRNTTFCLLQRFEYHFFVPVVAIRSIRFVLLKGGWRRLLGRKQLDTVAAPGVAGS